MLLSTCIKRLSTRPPTGSVNIRAFSSSGTKCSCCFRSDQRFLFKRGNASYAHLLDASEVKQCMGVSDDTDYSRQMMAQRNNYLLSAADAKVHKKVRLSEREYRSDLDDAAMKRLMVGKYKHFWYGEVLMKDAFSLTQYQMLISTVRPGTVFDLGTCGGGGALWFSSQLKALSLANSIVVTCDIVDRRSSNCAKVMQEAGNVHFLLADLGDGPALFAKLEAMNVQLPKPWIIAEDCHLDAQILLDTFRPRMDIGDYIVFEDTHPSQTDDIFTCAKDEDCDKKWAAAAKGSFALSKYNLMAAAMKRLDGEFEIDATIQDLNGYNATSYCNGIFVKVK